MIPVIDFLALVLPDCSTQQLYRLKKLQLQGIVFKSATIKRRSTDIIDSSTVEQTIEQLKLYFDKKKNEELYEQVSCFDIGFIHKNTDTQVAVNNTVLDFTVLQVLHYKKKNIVPLIPLLEAIFPDVSYDGARKRIRNIVRSVSKEDILVQDTKHSTYILLCNLETLLNAIYEFCKERYAQDIIQFKESDIYQQLKQLQQKKKRMQTVEAVEIVEKKRTKRKYASIGENENVEETETTQDKKKMRQNNDITPSTCINQVSKLMKNIVATEKTRSSNEIAGELTDKGLENMHKAVDWYDIYNIYMVGEAQFVAVDAIVRSLYGTTHSVQDFDLVYSTIAEIEESPMVIVNATKGTVLLHIYDFAELMTCLDRKILDKTSMLIKPKTLSAIHIRDPHKTRKVSIDKVVQNKFL